MTAYHPEVQLCNILIEGAGKLVPAGASQERQWSSDTAGQPMTGRGSALLATESKLGENGMNAGGS